MQLEFLTDDEVKRSIGWSESFDALVRRGRATRLSLIDENDQPVVLREGEARRLGGDDDVVKAHDRGENVV